MKRRLLLGLVLVATLLSLRPLVFACGLEETWIPGIYDGGDTDDALALAGSKAIAPEVSPVVPAADLLLNRATLTLTEDPESHNAVAVSSRAPPLL
jgi:hypothetical protein